MEIPDWLSSTLASDAAAGKGAIASLAPLRPGQLAVGPASTVKVAAGDNDDLREAIRGSDGTGRVLVVAGSADSGGAVFGDMMGAWMEAGGSSEALIEVRW